MPLQTIGPRFQPEANQNQEVSDAVIVSPSLGRASS